MIRYRVTIASRFVNAVGLDEYQPLAISRRQTDMARKRTVCERCDGECEFICWTDADTRGPSWPCSRCRGTGYVPLGRFRTSLVRRPS